MSSSMQASPIVMHSCSFCSKSFVTYLGKRTHQGKKCCSKDSKNFKRKSGIEIPGDQDQDQDPGMVHSYFRKPTQQKNWVTCEVCELGFHAKTKLVEHIFQQHRSSHVCCGIIFINEMSKSQHICDPNYETSIASTTVTQTQTQVKNLESRKTVAKKSSQLTHDESNQAKVNGSIKILKIFETKNKSSPSASTATEAKEQAIKLEEKIPTEIKQEITLSAADLLAILEAQSQAQMQCEDEAVEGLIIKTEAISDDETEHISQFSEIPGGSLNFKTGAESFQNIVIKKEVTSDYDQEDSEEFTHQENAKDPLLILKTEPIQNPLVKTEHEYDTGNMQEIQNFSKPVEDEMDSEDTDEDEERNTYKCNLCDLPFLQNSSLERHMARTHPIPNPIGVRVVTLIDEYDCSLCNLQFTSQYLRNKHIIKAHGDNRPYKCSQCPMSYGLKSSLNLHICRSHRRGKRSTCLVCKRDFFSDRGLRTHLVSHRVIRKKLFKCSLCQASFTTKLNLDEHQEGTHKATLLPNPDGKYVCRFCHKVFGTKWCFDQHAETHTFQHKPENTCKDCDESFPNLSALKAHVTLAHNDEDSFQCTVCHIRFRTMQILRKHSKMHIQETETDPCNYNYKCPICNETFMIVKDFDLHLKRNHADAANE